jgi:hypothetical protein
MRDQIKTVGNFARLRIETPDVCMCRQLQHVLCERLLRAAQGCARVFNICYSIGIVNEKIRQDSSFALVKRFESCQRLPCIGDAAPAAGAALTGDERNYSSRYCWTFDLARQCCAGCALHRHLERTECGRVPRQRRVVKRAVDQWSGAAQHSHNRCV